jgi:hypothetical protein
MDDAPRTCGPLLRMEQMRQARRTGGIILIHATKAGVESKVETDSVDDEIRFGIHSSGRNVSQLRPSVV